MSNCHLVAGRSLIDLVASRLALRAPALRAATTLTRPNRSAQRLPCGRHSVPTAKTVGQDRGFRAIAPPSQVRRDCLLISNASCGLGGFGCAAHAVRKMSLPSPQSRRTWLAKLVGSTATSGQCISCVADAMCQCPLISVTAPQRANGEIPSEGSRQQPRCYSQPSATMSARSRPQPPLTGAVPDQGQAEAAGYPRDLGSTLRVVLTYDEPDRERIHTRSR